MVATVAGGSQEHGHGQSAGDTAIAHRGSSAEDAAAPSLLSSPSRLFLPSHRAPSSALLPQDAAEDVSAAAAH